MNILSFEGWRRGDILMRLPWPRERSGLTRVSKGTLLAFGGEMWVKDPR